MLRDNPETTVDSRIGTQSQIEYFFQTSGTVAIRFIEMPLKSGK